MNQVKFHMEEKHVHATKVWGYVVCFGTIITFIAGMGHVNSFGLIYKDFIIDSNSSAKSLTSAHGVFAIMLAIGGIILNILSKNISLRLGGLIGAMAFSTGSLTTIAISNTNQLPLTFGILQGIGFGMMVPVCYSMINRYFEKKRTTVMSVVKAIQGLVLMWYPQLIERIIHNFGFRGTLLIIAGISLNTFPGMLVMKKKKLKTRVRITTNVEIGKDANESENLVKNNKLEVVQKETHSNSMRRLKIKILEILNLKSCKDPVYCNICLGQSFVNFSDLTFFILLPMLFFQYGYDTGEVATCISICAGADVAGRCILAVISSISDVNTRVLFYVSTFLTFGFRIVVLHIRSFVYVASVTGVLGVLRAWLHVSSPLVISSQVSHEDFPGAYALFMLAAGLVNVTCSPIVGLLKDIYGDYTPAFYALTSCCLPCLIAWPIEYFIKK